MKRYFYLGACLMIFTLFAGCEKEDLRTTTGDDALELRANSLKETVKLCGAKEVPATDTKGIGKFEYELNEDGTISYTLSARKMNSNVTQSHIHLNGCGANGGVVAFLFGPFFPDGVPADGELIQGTLTDASLRGALAGKTIADLVAQIEAGNAYVNVHSVTIPSGEIRGQLGDRNCNCGLALGNSDDD